MTPEKNNAQTTPHSASSHALASFIMMSSSFIGRPDARRISASGRSCSAACWLSVGEHADAAAAACSLVADISYRILIESRAAFFGSGLYLYLRCRCVCSCMQAPQSIEALLCVRPVRPSPSTSASPEVPCPSLSPPISPSPEHDVLCVPGSPVRVVPRPV